MGIHHTMKDEDSQFYRVNLNGVSVEFDGPSISYEQIVRKAFPKTPADLSDFSYLVTIDGSEYTGRRSRVLTPEDSVEKFDGMFIHCAKIDSE
jgi:hypothetical protein